MKHLGLLLVLLSLPSRSLAAETDLSGNWRGTLQAGGARLRLVFKLANANGTYTAAMDSLDQGVRDVPVDLVRVSDGSLHLEIKLIQASYDGKWDAAGKKITGLLKQAGQTFPLELQRMVGAANEAIEPEPLSPAALAASKEAAKKLSGVWSGSLHAPEMTLRLRLAITNTPAGIATGTLDSPDQNVAGVPLSDISVTNNRARFEARGLAGVFEGTLGADGTLKGQWRQGGSSSPLELKRSPAR